MAEDYANYDAMMEEARRWALHDDDSNEPTDEAQGIATAEDLRLLETRLREQMDLVLHRMEELHFRVWTLEERVNAVEAQSEQS